MNKKQFIIFGTVYLFLLRILTYIFWIFSIFWFILTLIFYWNFLYIIIFPFKKFKNKDYNFFSIKNYGDFLLNFLYRAWILVLFFILLIWFFSFYQNDYKPALMPTYTISNWEKTVVFQGMSHIASPNFYEKVKQKIIRYKKEWYVLFFEWVKPWTKENKEKFDKALWFSFDKDLYSIMSEFYWLTNQDNRMFLNLVNNYDYNVDISLDEIVKYYEELKLELNIKKVYQEPLKITDSMKKKLEEIDERKLQVFRYINKAFISVIIKNENIQDTFLNNFWNKELFEIILNKRNEILANQIINWENKKIIVLYWLLHFRWTFEILKQNDPKWHIKEIKYDEVLK